METQKSAARLGTLGYYFALAERVSEGRRFLEQALSVVDDGSPSAEQAKLVQINTLKAHGVAVNESGL